MCGSLLTLWDKQIVVYSTMQLQFYPLAASGPNSISSSIIKYKQNNRKHLEEFLARCETKIKSLLWTFRPICRSVEWFVPISQVSRWDRSLDGANASSSKRLLCINIYNICFLSTNDIELWFILIETLIHFDEVSTKIN